MGEGWDGGMDNTKARELRKNMTDAERALWKHLRLRQFCGHKFRRQQPMGRYIVDFVCFEKRLIIEVDGGFHSEQIIYGSNRDAWFEEQGFRVLRFWDNQVLTEIDAVKDKIMQALSWTSPPHLHPPPQGGRKWEVESSRKEGGDEIRPR